MKTFFFLMLFSISAFAQDISWDQFRGCYKTLSFNHHQVIQAPENFPQKIGHIGSSTDTWIVDPTTLQMTPVMEFQFFQTYQPRTQSAYADGSYAILQSQDANGSHFQYDGKNIFSVAGAGLYTIHIHLDLQKQENGQLLAHFSRTADEYPLADVNDTYALSKVDCPTN